VLRLGVPIKRIELLLVVIRSEHGCQTTFPLPSPLWNRGF